MFHSSVLSLTKIEGWGFSDCLVVRIWRFHRGGPGSIPEWGTIPPAGWCGQNLKKKKDSCSGDSVLVSKSRCFLKYSSNRSLLG